MMDYDTRKEIMNARRGLLVIFIFFVSATTALWSQAAPTPSARPAASAVPALPADIPDTAERFKFLMMGNEAGQQAVWTASDGTLHVFFQFNDRGRGPKTTSILRVDSNGVPVSETVTGNDYLKSSVDETFSNAGGLAQWKNTAEKGEKKISAPAYYAPLNGAPSEFGLLARRSSQWRQDRSAPRRRSAGQRVTDVEVASGGQKKRVALYSITGLDFSPTYVWAR